MLYRAHAHARDESIYEGITIYSNGVRRVGQMELVFNDLMVRNFGGLRNITELRGTEVAGSLKGVIAVGDMKGPGPLTASVLRQRLAPMLQVAYSQQPHCLFLQHYLRVPH